MAIKYDGIGTGWREIVMNSVQLKGRRDGYLVVYVDDHVLTDNLPIMRRAIGWGRYDPGRKEHGKDGRHLCRIFLRMGNEILEGFWNTKTAYNLVRWSI